VFEWLQRHGNVDDAEMHRVFNCGIGMVLTVDARDVAAAIAFLGEAGETAYDIGEIVARPPGAPHAIVA
jgi:phosphoribosylformylglycinamidine cyclo-ligase